MFNTFFSRFFPGCTVRIQSANGSQNHVLIVASSRDGHVFTEASRAMGLYPVDGYTQAQAEHQAGNGINAAVIVLPCSDVDAQAVAVRIRAEKGDHFPLFIYSLEPDTVPATLLSLGTALLSRRDMSLHDLLSRVRESVGNS